MNKLSVLVAALLVACGGSTPSAKTTPTGGGDTAPVGGGTAGADKTPGAKGSLYDSLGGTPAITAVVDEFIARVAADARIKHRFFNTDIPRLKRLLVE